MKTTKGQLRDVALRKLCSRDENVRNKISARDWRAFNLVLTECSERGRKEEGKEKKRELRGEEEGRDK